MHSQSWRPSNLPSPESGLKRIVWQWKKETRSKKTDCRWRPTTTNDRCVRRDAQRAGQLLLRQRQARGLRAVQRDVDGPHALVAGRRAHLDDGHHQPAPRRHHGLGPQRRPFPGPFSFFNRITPISHSEWFLCKFMCLYLWRSFLTFCYFRLDPKQRPFSFYFATFLTLRFLC